jgi:hypothetical protein
MKTAKRVRNRRAKTMRGGKVFEGLRYISEGAQGATYLTRNNKILKFLKRGETGDEEVKIHSKINELRLPYFPKFIKYGKGYTNDPIINSAPNGITTLLPAFTELFNSNRNGAYEYNYILMEFIKNSKKFPDYISGKIEEIIPGKTRPLTNEEIDVLVDHIIQILCKLTFAFYVAMKVYNFTHKDFHMNNCLIRENGDPVIIDFGGSTLHNNTRLNNIRGGTGYDVRSFINQMFGEGFYDHELKNLRPYIMQLRNHPKISRLLEIPFGHGRRSTIERIATTLESIQTNSDVRPFDYMRTFTNMGIDKSEIARAGIKIKYRSPVVVPQVVVPREQKIQEVIQSVMATGFAISYNNANQYLTRAQDDPAQAVQLYMQSLFN